MTTKSPPAGASDRIERSDTREIRASEPMQRPSERSRVANKEWYPGLCTTCVDEPVCTFTRPVGRSVMFCEEFDGAVEVKPRLTLESMPPTERLAVVDHGRVRGLCMTCERREACAFPKPEGGVFHCEEFE